MKGVILDGEQVQIILGAEPTMRICGRVQATYTNGLLLVQAVRETAAKRLSDEGEGVDITPFRHPVFIPWLSIALLELPHFGADQPKRGPIDA